MNMIIKPFNGVFWCYMGVLVGLCVLLWVILRNKSETAKKWTIIAICVANIAFYWIYKYSLRFDSEFLAITGRANFSWFKELPIQLCNINMFLIPVALLVKNRYLLGFSFHIGPLAALMAILFPQPAFTGYSLLLMRNLGFYFTHGLILVCALSLGTLGFVKPKFKDFPGIIVTLLVLSLIIHGVNTLLRMSVCPDANYFFTYEAEVSLLQLFWKLIPVPYIYLIPALVILLPYMSIVTLICKLIDKISNRKIDDPFLDSCNINVSLNSTQTQKEAEVK